MYLRASFVRVSLVLGKAIVYLISVPLALLALAISVFYGNSRLQYQRIIRSFLGIVLGGTPVIMTDYDMLTRTPGPFILAANHVNYFDWMLLYSRINMNMSVVVDSFFTRFPFSTVTKNAGFLAIKQKRSFSQSREILHILEAIRKKEPVLIFINSRTDHSSFFDSIKPGAAYLSIKTQVPVIPVHIQELGPKKGLAIKFGCPIYPETEDVSKTGEFIQRIGRSIRSLA